MRLPIHHVDAFADRPFAGNPAAVVILERWLPDALMQAIAAQNNLSETAFVMPAGHRFGLRWFTPRIEVPLCGHATLATAFVLRVLRGVPAQTMVFETRSGALGVVEEGGRFTLDFPAMGSVADPASREPLEHLLGVPLLEVHAAPDRYLCLLGSAEAVRLLRPDMQGLAALPLPGVIVTAAGDAPFDFTSRYFAPAKGVPEDPVTGAAHCVLAPFWAKRLGRSRLSAFQASARGGAVACTVEAGRVLLGGGARLYLQGEIIVEP